MAQVPIKQGSSWQELKFYYTADDGTTIITSQRLYYGEGGQDRFLDVPPMFYERLVSDPKIKKEKFWGKPENLRKIEITYEEPRNNTGKAETARYCPFNPTSGRIIDYIKQMRDVCENKFSPYKVVYCTDYRGENRHTIVKPERINQLLT